MKKLLNEHEHQWLNTITDNTEFNTRDPAEIFTSLIRNLDIKPKTHKEKDKAKTVQMIFHIKRLSFDRS